MEEFEFFGSWWIPTEQPIAVPGKLTFSNQEGIHLALMGSFKPLHELQEFKKYPIIIGVTQEGKPISLSECTETGGSIGFGGANYVKQRFMIQSIYIGFHFSNPQEIRFHRMAAQYSYLPHWANLPLLQSSYTTNKEGELERYEMSYSPPDKIVANTSRGTITLTTSFQSTNNSLLEVNFRQSVWLEMETENAIPVINWLQQFIGPLQNLLTLSTCKPNFLLNLQGYMSDHSRTRSNGEVDELPIQIIYQQFYYAPQISKNLLSHEMLFNLQDIRDNFSQLIENWFQIAEDLDSVCNLFFGIQYLDRLYLEQRFLNIIQAVESYHRRRSDKRDLPDEGHKKRIEVILAGTPQEYKKWLSGKLKYSNELSLRQRLKDLLDDTHRNQVVLPLVGKKKIFIDKVVNTRNFLTHYDKSGQEGIATGIELYHIIQILVFLLQSCFLHELGISSKQSLELFRRNALYQHVLNQNP